MAESCSVPSSDRTELCYWTEEPPVPTGDRPTRHERNTEYATMFRPNERASTFAWSAFTVRGISPRAARARDGCTFIRPCTERTCIRSCICTAYRAPYNQAYPTYCDRQGRSYPPRRCRKRLRWLT